MGEQPLPHTHTVSVMNLKPRCLSLFFNFSFTHLFNWNITEKQEMEANSRYCFRWCLLQPWRVHWGLLLLSLKVSSCVFLLISFQCVETLRCWRTTVWLTPSKSKRVSVIHSSSSQPTWFFATASLRPRPRPGLPSWLCWGSCSSCRPGANTPVVLVVSAPPPHLVAVFSKQKQGTIKCVF